jgi:hypothetical protein
MAFDQFRESEHAVVDTGQQHGDRCKPMRR